MIIPSVFFGKYTDVRARTAKIADRLLAGKTFAEAMPDARCVNTFTTTVGACLLRTLPDISVTRLDFHLTLLRAALARGGELVPDAVTRVLFSELMQKEWGPLVFADRKDGWFGASLAVDNRHLWKPYLAAVLKFAPIYTAEKKRFVDERGNTANFWQANSSLNYILAESGIPEERLKDRLAEAPFRAMCLELGC